MLGLHPRIGVVDRAGNDNQRGGEEGRILSQKAALIEDEGRDHHVGDIVDYRVEHVARPVRPPDLDLELARKRPVYTIHQQGRTEPQECSGEAALGSGHQ